MDHNLKREKKPSTIHEIKKLPIGMFLQKGRKWLYKCQVGTGSWIEFVALYEDFNIEKALIVGLLIYLSKTFLRFNSVI